MSVTLAYVITGVIAYLLGSISTGILVAQKNHGPVSYTHLVAPGRVVQLIRIFSELVEV